MWCHLDTHVLHHVWVDYTCYSSIILCNKCNFKTVGIKNIENHICEEVEYEIEDEDTVNSENDINNLKTLLLIEKTKNNIYLELLKQNTYIKLERSLCQIGVQIHYVYSTKILK